MTRPKYIPLLARQLLCNSIVYKIYEKILWNQIKDGETPEHIGVILDGNRRWASEHFVPLWAGHQTGADKVEDLLNWCLDLKVRTTTLYILSTENFNRSEREVHDLMRLFNERLTKVLSNKLIHEQQVKIRAIGRIALLPKKTRDLIATIEESTKGYDRYYMNMAIAYGGRAEIIDATKKISEKVRAGEINLEDIDESTIEKHLYTSHLPNSEPDLIIRSSGEARLSGFLLWQGAYSELCFVDVYWPDFRRIDLWRAIRTYQRRERRYGT